MGLKARCCIHGLIRTNQTRHRAICTSTRFDKFFRMGCDLNWSASIAIDYIVDTLKLPWDSKLQQLGMRWSFSYRIVFKNASIPLSQTLEQAGVSAGSVLKLKIDGTYEDLWENELQSIRSVNKIFSNKVFYRTSEPAVSWEEQELLKRINSRAPLTSARLKEIADSCFLHI